MAKSSEKSKEVDLDKGGLAEEALKRYFQSLGSFVVRGPKVRAGRDNVTDIDVWVYTRASVNSRHITIVDVKNKRRAKGYERLIWQRGLQSAVGADEAIVATSGSKEELRPFADRVGIKLLSAQVLKAVIVRFAPMSSRLSSEQLDALWRKVRVEGAKDLAALMETNLVELGLGLSFTAMNVWIDEAAKLLVYCHDHERRPGAAARAVLMLAALVAICADYMGRNAAFADIETRRSYFREGLLFGNAEAGTANRYLSFAEKVSTDFVDPSGATAASIRVGFNNAVDKIPIAAFIDLFARPAAGRELFDAAMQLEIAAFSSSEPNFSALPPEGKTIIALLIDYAGLERARFFKLSGEAPQRSLSGGGQPASTAGASRDHRDLAANDEDVGSDIGNEHRKSGLLF